MWWTHRPKARIPGGDQRQDDDRIENDRAAREGRDDLADEAGRRQEDDVDFGVAEEPEQVLPQQRVAALRRIVEMGADQPVGQQEGSTPAPPTASRRSPSAR
jgi:hypothetical protein